MILSGLLSESNTNFSSTDVEPTQNGYDPSGAGAYQIVSESMQEMHRINTAMNVVDYKSIQMLAESQTEDMQALQEGAINDFFGKIKQAIMKMWAKIKEFFSNVRLHLSKVMKDDKFVSKYKDELMKASTMDFKYEGFNYNIDAIDIGKIQPAFEAAFKSKISGKASLDVTSPDNVVAKLKAGTTDQAKSVKTEVLEKQGELSKEVLDEVRKAVVGEGEADEYKTKVLETLRGGEEKKELSVTVSAIIATIEGKDKGMTALNKAAEAANKAFKAAVDWVGKAEKAVNNNVGKLSADEEKAGARDAFSVGSELLRFYASLNQKALGLLSTTAGYKVDAVKENVSQARDIAQKLLIHNRKGGKKKLNESTQLGDEGNGVLGNIISML